MKGQRIMSAGEYRHSPCHKRIYLMALMVGMLCCLCPGARAGWHWELLRDDFPTNTLYDGFVEFQEELFRVTLQHPDSGEEGEPTSASVSKSADGLSWTVVDDAPEFPQGEVIRLLVYKDELWLFIRLQNPSNFNLYTTEIWKSATGRDWSYLIEMNSLHALSARYNDFTVVQNKVWCVAFSHEFPPNYSFILNTENGIDWESLYPPLFLAGYFVSSPAHDDQLILIGSSNLYDSYGISPDGLSWDVFTIGPFGNLDPNDYAEQIVEPTYIFHNETLFRLGGYFSGRFENIPHDNIFYSYDLTTWKEYTCGTWWSPRARPIAVNFKNELWVFGGEYTNGNGDSEIWRFVPGEPVTLEEGEGSSETYHSADTNFDGSISLSELLALIQIFNSFGYYCDECCGYELGYGALDCTPHSSDYNPADGVINLSELLRIVQLFNVGNYHYCPGVSEDNFCPGTAK